MLTAVHGPWDGVNRQQQPGQHQRRYTTTAPHYRHHNVIPHKNYNHREGSWRFRNRNRIFFRTGTDSSSTDTMMRMSTTSSAQIDTILQHVATMGDDDCNCCGGGGDNHDYDDGRPNDGTTCRNKNNNEWVIRHVHQSTIDPALWQQYMVPPLISSSWGHVLLATNTNRPTTVDISFLWNSTTTATTATATTRQIQNDAMTATAERFWELYEAKRALVVQQQSGHRPPPWFEKLWDSFANNNNNNSPEPITTSPNPYRKAMIQNLASAMTEFSNFCEEHLLTTPHHDRHHHRTFEMRLLCTYGSDAAKCPIWHVDHVPCRYVQTLYGPTVLFLPDQHDNQRVYHRIITAQQQQQQQQEDNYEFVSVPERNAFLLRDIDDMSRRSVVGHAHVGEGMILLGQSSSRSPPWNTTGAAVHKSPWIASPDQGRILLTINVHDTSKT